MLFTSYKGSLQNLREHHNLKHKMYVTFKTQYLGWDFTEQCLFGDTDGIDSSITDESARQTADSK